MKKAIRIILPILLAVSIILCMAWYLFEYDREFTRDVLLSCARYFEGKGNHTTATVFYNLAYSQSGNSDAVAIELAEQYKAGGNYTKAEFTLSNAIADGGDVELYISLCKTYIEQDKLLDAVNMLNSITNPVIKAKLDELRPKAPTVSHAPGFYSQYIPVEVQAESGTLYVTTDGTYPSLAHTPYFEPIELVQGENTIYALTVAENGLVSPLATFGYIVGGVIEEVHFVDAAFEAEIRSILDVDAETVIYTNALWDVSSFTMPKEAKTYDDLKYLSYLTSLTIDSGVEEALGSINTLATLHELHITNTEISVDQLKDISLLPSLSKLTLRDCAIANIVPLEAAKNLVYLDLSYNSIRNLSSLAGLTKLEELYLQHNALSDLKMLSGLSELKKLDVSFNTLTSLIPITNLTKLTWLDANTNRISTIGDLNKLTALTYLSLAQNKIADITKVSACRELTDLNIANNAIADITALETLTKLVYFNFSYNEVTALPAWPKDCALVTIDGTQNLLETLEPLQGLQALNNVYMDYNEAIESVEPLATCPVIVHVNVYGTKVADVSSLTDQSVIVNYTPVQVDEEEETE